MRSTWRWMPESLDSTGYGTRIRSPSVWPVGGGAIELADANSHVPFRFCHWVRVSCGRGYSGSAFVGETSFAHGVSIVYVELFVAGTENSSSGPSASAGPPAPSYLMRTSDPR